MKKVEAGDRGRRARMVKSCFVLSQLYIETLLEVQLPCSAADNERSQGSVTLSALLPPKCTHYLRI